MAKKKKSIGDALSDFMNKSFGEGTAVPPIELKSDVRHVLDIGLPHLQRACSKSIDDEFGLPLGRVVGVYGGAKAGKTTLCLMIAIGALKEDGVVIYIDQERTLTTDYIRTVFKNNGVVDQALIKSNLILIQPSEEMVKKKKRLTIEEIEIRVKAAMEKIKSLREEVGFFPCVLIWDTISMTSTDSELKTAKKTKEAKGNVEVDDPKPTKAKAKNAQPGSHARALRAFFRKCYDDFVETEAMLVMVAQQTSNIGFAGSSFLGKAAISFAVSLLLHISRKEYITDEDKQVGIKGEIRIKENKTQPPYIKDVPYRVMFNHGYDQIYDLDYLLRRSGLFGGDKGKVEINVLGEDNFEYNRIDVLERRFAKLPKDSQQKLISRSQMNYKITSKIDVMRTSKK